MSLRTKYSRQINRKCKSNKYFFYKYLLFFTYQPQCKHTFCSSTATSSRSLHSYLWSVSWDLPSPTSSWTHPGRRSGPPVPSSAWRRGKIRQRRGQGVETLCSSRHWRRSWQAWPFPKTSYGGGGHPRTRIKVHFARALQTWLEHFKNMSILAGYVKKK